MCFYITCLTCHSEKLSWTWRQGIHILERAAWMSPTPVTFSASRNEVEWTKGSTFLGPNLVSVSLHLTSSSGGLGEIWETSFHFSPMPAMLGLFPRREVRCVPVPDCIHFPLWSQGSKVIPCLRAHLCCSGNLPGGIFKASHTSLNHGPHCQTLTLHLFLTVQESGQFQCRFLSLPPLPGHLPVTATNLTLFAPIVCHQCLCCTYSSRHRRRSESSWKPPCKGKGEGKGRNLHTTPMEETGRYHCTDIAFPKNLPFMSCFSLKSLSLSRSFKWEKS